jgi:hypothetical protein
MKAHSLVSLFRKGALKNEASLHCTSVSIEKLQETVLGDVKLPVIIFEKLLIIDVCVFLGGRIEIRLRSYIAHLAFGLVIVLLSLSLFLSGVLLRGGLSLHG